MNKYIKTDIEQAITLMKVAIMNALHDIESGEETTINLGPNISWNLFYECLLESDWKNNEDFDPMDTNGWEVDFWTHWVTPSKKKVLITGSLYCGLDYCIELDDDRT